MKLAVTTKKSWQFFRIQDAQVFAHFSVNFLKCFSPLVTTVLDGAVIKPFFVLLTVTHRELRE